ncbi:uncharacterized protein LAJ45_01668 [Morchella importuna]|uniref:uncharacterized protein n=1 Tax=Morchella importuna TaxID=1174673 RepID=UPI001E8E91D9|nr:uncharacterized protein LAJ45_01668 [Morchella importuna]KAH8153901.1 hypothetical protein LAJ45_01668 [Morchella importuna]
MSLFPFPARGGSIDVPPPVPPKHVAACVVTTKAPKHKKSSASLSKGSLESLVNLYTSRNASPTKQLSLDTTVVPAAASPPSSPDTPKTSTLTRAKGVFVSRRKGSSSSDLDTLTTVQENCMDSPTIPGRPALPPSWRNASQPFSTPPLASTSTSVSPTERPISPFCLPDTTWPDTPWPGVNLASKNISNKLQEYYDSPPPPLQPPAVPPKAALQRSPAFLDREKPAIEKTVTFERERPADVRAVVKYMERPLSPPLTRPRADSAPTLTTTRRRRKKNSFSGPLPQGVRPAKAPTHYTYSQLQSLQLTARQRSEAFGVLGTRDVEVLSRELGGLETRCQYLRETHRSLRSGRKALQKRMLGYLRSAASEGVKRECLLRQEEALAELDVAIEDWEDKLEKAEERRALVKEKLLEHMAAALCVGSCGCSPLEKGMATPPATPERRKRSDKEYHMEKIYTLRILPC